MSAAADAFALAQFDVCRRLIRASHASGKRERAEAALLDARTSAALGDQHACFDAASLAAQAESPSDRALALALRGASAKALGKMREARASLDAAAREVARLSAVDAALARNVLAADALAELDLATAEKYARANVAAGVEEASSSVTLGWIEFKHDRTAEATANFSGALRKSQSTGPDVRTEALALRGLAFVASETADLHSVERARKAYAKIAWPQDLGETQAAVLSSLRLASLLEGDLTRAFFEAREAIGVAPSAVRRASAEIDAAVVSRVLGDRIAHGLQLSRAWTILRTERLEAGNLEARQTLAAFLIEAAASMPAEVRKALALYRTIAPKPAAGDNIATDRFTLALEAMAVGRASDALGDERAAERLYEKALELFEFIGFTARAAVVALDLRRLTGDDAYAATVKRSLERAPNAWFVAEFEAQDGPIERLSTAELVVLAHLLRGDTAKAIGEKLERSPFTISNHTRKIFWAFGVNSRAKVIAICAQLGVTPASIERLVN